MIVVFTAPTQLKTPATGVRLYAMDCGHIHVSDANEFADDGSFAAEAPFPVAVTDHSDRRGSQLGVVLAEIASQRDGNAEGREIVR